MKKVFMLTAAFALMALGSSSFGQRVMMVRNGGSMTLLLNRSDVKKEIKLTEGQISKIEDIASATQDEMRSLFHNGGDEDEIRKQVMKLREESDERQLATLEAEQKKRLKELWIQRIGMRVVSDEKIAKEVDLSPQQLAEIKKLSDANDVEVRGVMERVMEGELSREDAQKIVSKNNETLNVTVAKILTETQLAKLKSMGGKPFKFEEDTAVAIF